MHADLARSMFLRFPVQSRSMCGFRTFHAKPQFACFPAFHAKLQVACFRTFHAKPQVAYFPAFHAKPQIACFRAFASRANAVSGKCGFPCECCSRGVCLPGERACAGTLQTRAFFLCLYVRIIIYPVTGALPRIRYQQYIFGIFPRFPGEIERHFTKNISMASVFWQIF